MISKANFSLPYPALGLEEDFKEGEFSIKPNIYTAGESLHIKEEKLEITNPYLRELYLEGKITPAYKIDCPPTLYNITLSGKDHYEIPLKLLANFIKVEVFLIAKEDIKNYTHETFNDDYFLGTNKGVFNIEKGNILGFAGFQKIGLKEAYRKGGAGIFSFKRSDNEFRPLQVDPGDSGIEITYPHLDNEYDMVNTLPRNMKLTFLNLFIIPALTEAFRLLRNAYDEDREEEFIAGKEWAYIVSEAYPSYPNEDPLTSAQKYVHNLISKGDPNIATPLLEAFKKELK